MEKKEFKPEVVSHLDVSEVYQAVGTTATGLTQQQADSLQELYGKNLIEEAKGKSKIIIFLLNFTHLMALLLWIGGVVAFVAGMPELGIAIFLVNVINGTFSFWQENRANNATEALKKMLPSYVRVIRDGTEQKILSEDLVPGDVMILEEGDKISADARVVACQDLQVNQSTLTGESNPVRKTSDAIVREDITQAEMPNLIFAGTSVSEGNANAVVLRIGMDTAFGKIAQLTQTMKEVKSPLQKELDHLTKQISLISVSLGILFFVASVFFVKESVAFSFIFALGMIVAFIPEGLLPTVTLALAMAVQRMSKRHALVKKLSSVETLGSTSVICTDKTGTLTQNEMTVSYVHTVSHEFQISGVGYAPEGSITAEEQPVDILNQPDLELTLRAATLCSNARLLPPNEENPRYTVLGDPTEACLSVAARKAGLEIDDWNTRFPRVRELPFESRRKRMASIHLINNERVAFVKGAPKETIDLCSQMQIDGKIQPLDAATRNSLMEINDTYARNGLRVLAVAMRNLSNNATLPTALSAYTPETIEHDMIFLGLVVMSDPPRPEVSDAVAQCHRAGIRVIMITGDYGLTAESIARRIGIITTDQARVISGMELEKMDDTTLKQVLRGEVIFARVAPEQKLQVVSALQEMGEIVAVTGDGVNDSPALKKADIGVAMGIAGTDVAKESADMILTDDNFASIIHAIEEGRGVYANIRKFILYILNSNMPEAAPSAMFLFSRGGIPLPLTIMQILCIDLGTDMLPALGLGVEAPEPDIMDKKPRDPKEPLLNKTVMIKGFLWYGMLESFALAVSYFFVNYLNGWPAVPLAGGSDPVYFKATTMALASIVFCQIGMVLNCRTENASIFSVGVFSNKRILFGIGFELVLILLISYLPILQSVFQTAPLNLQEWLFLCIWPFFIVGVEELRKYVVRRRKQNKSMERMV
ncbi:MAG: cation-translocating P-type ATPase [Erysipelotrichaceae bacterium]